MAESSTSMLTLLREARGWSQKTLAEKAHLSQAVISRLEASPSDIGEERLGTLAAALDCPPSVLVSDPTVPAMQISCLHHRRRSSTMTVGTMRRIEAVTHLTRLSIEGLLQNIDPQAPLPLKRMPVEETRTPVTIARALRRAWSLPAGPIGNLVKSVESAGIVVVVRDLDTSGQDAVSTWPADARRPPMMVVNSGLPADRFRFTVAHELGHLLMHDTPGSEQEAEANSFASEFLAPAEKITPDLEGLRTGDFRRLLTLKHKWGMSMAALIRRARDTGQITDRQYREFHMRLGQLGWRTSEPGTLPDETPRTVSQIIRLHRDVHHMDTPEIAALAGMNEPAFRRHYLHESPQPTAKTPLTLGADDD